MDSNSYVPARFVMFDGTADPIVAVRVGADGAVTVVAGREGHQSDAIVDGVMAAIAADWDTDLETVLAYVSAADGDVRVLVSHSRQRSGENAGTGTGQDTPNTVGNQLCDLWSLPLLPDFDRPDTRGSVWVLRLADTDGTALVPVEDGDYSDILTLARNDAEWMGDVEHHDMSAALALVGYQPPSLVDMLSALPDFGVISLDGGPGDDAALDSLGAFLASLGVGDADADGFDDVPRVERLSDGVNVTTGAQVFAVDADQHRDQ